MVTPGLQLRARAVRWALPHEMAEREHDDGPQGADLDDQPASAWKDSLLLNPPCISSSYTVRLTPKPLVHISGQPHVGNTSRRA